MADQRFGNKDVTIVDESGNEVSSGMYYRYGGGKSAYVATIASGGDTVAITPASGKKIRVLWVAFVPNSDNTAANLIKVGYGAASTITTELYRGYALAHWEVFEGATNHRVIINAGTAESVAVTIHYQEIT